MAAIMTNALSSMHSNSESAGSSFQDNVMNGHNEQMLDANQTQRNQLDLSHHHQHMPQQYQYQGPMPLPLKHYKPGQKPSFSTLGDPDFDGRRLRRTTMRKTVDYNSSIIKELECRLWQRDFRDRDHLQPDVLYIPHVLPPPSYKENPFNAVTTRFVKTATNKIRCPVFCLAWTPEGRRLITGTSSGEFTLWNGLTFNFETILQAHDCPVRTMVWSNNELWMLTGDHSGYIKYWQSNMNNVKTFQGHREAVRGVSFSPTDNKFVSCSDDGTVRLWDFITYNEERIFRGHGADVKCVHWHPYKSLIASGSKDNQQPVKLWDPRSAKSIATVHAHKSTVMDLKWNQNGNWFATASRDHLLKLYDIRNLGSEMQVFRGHKKETSIIAWHPQHEGLMCSGGSDGSILFWHVGTPKEVASIDQAHESIVWALAWHPLGHILCSGSNDHTCKFWTRNYPGDQMRDKYNLNTFPQSILGFDEYEDESGTVKIPGMGPEDRIDATQLPENFISSIPGLDNTVQKDKSKVVKKVPYAKPIPKNFQAQWNSESRSKDIFDENFIPDSKMMAAKLFEHAPGAVEISCLKIDALYMYGKIVLTQENPELMSVITEGRDKLVDYIHSGSVQEFSDVIPHLDYNEFSKRSKTQFLMKYRGRLYNEAVSSMMNQAIKPSDRLLLKRSMDSTNSGSTVPVKKWKAYDQQYPSDDYQENSNHRQHYGQQFAGGTNNYDNGSSSIMHNNYNNSTNNDGGNYNNNNDSINLDDYDYNYHNNHNSQQQQLQQNDYDDYGEYGGDEQDYQNDVWNDDQQHQMYHGDVSGGVGWNKHPGRGNFRQQQQHEQEDYEYDARNRYGGDTSRPLRGGRRGSGFVSRRPYGGGTNVGGGGGPGARFQQDNRYMGAAGIENENDYYGSNGVWERDVGGSGVVGGEQEEYYDGQGSGEYDNRYGSLDNYNDGGYYEEDSSAGNIGPGYGAGVGHGISGTRFHNNRGPAGGGRGPYRGTPNVWRGNRGGVKDLPPRRGRGRGPRR